MQIGITVGPGMVIGVVGLFHHLSHSVTTWRTVDKCMGWTTLTQAQFATMRCTIIIALACITNMYVQFLMEGLTMQTLIP